MCSTVLIFIYIFAVPNSLFGRVQYKKRFFKDIRSHQPDFNTGICLKAETIKQGKETR